MTYAVWEQIRVKSEPFSGIMAWSANRFNLAQGGEARYAEGVYVSADFFSVLGASTVLGRTFTAQDDQPGCGSPGAVISYAFWQREFGGDAGVLGRSQRLDGQALTIIGVTSPGFFGVEVGHRYERRGAHVFRSSVCRGR